MQEMRTMRENFHVQIRKEERRKDQAKKRCRPQMNQVSQILKQKPTSQNFNEIIQKYPLESLDLGELDCQQLMCYLTLVEDYQCNEFLVSNGVLKQLFEATKNLVDNYKFDSKSEFSLDYVNTILRSQLLTGIGNLIDFIQFPNEELEGFINKSMEIVDQLYCEDLCKTSIFLIEVYTQKCKLNEMMVVEWFKFLMRHLNMPNVSIQCLDQIINLQLDYDRIYKYEVYKLECNDNDLDQLFFLMDQQDRYCNQKISVILWNIYLHQSELLVQYFATHKVINLIERVFNLNDYIPLLKLLDGMYPNLMIYSKILLEKIVNQVNLDKLLLYDSLLKKMIIDQFLSNEEYKNALKECLKNGLHSTDSRECLQNILQQL